MGSLSKKTRFEIFKRDNFTCQYCGGTPPGHVLEVDHINPRSKGGGDSIDNLITSCFFCNRGKGAAPLSSVPQTLSDKSKILKEHEAQIREFNKLLKRKRAREDDLIDKINGIFKFGFSEYHLSDSFREKIRVQFLPYIPADDLLNSMSLAINKVSHDHIGAVKYFCGCCWNYRRRSER